MDKFFSPSSVNFISYRPPKPTQYGTVVVETIHARPERKSQQPERKAVTFEEREAALERSKKNFLQAWNDYIEFLKVETEENERCACLKFLLRQPFKIFLDFFTE